MKHSLRVVLAIAFLTNVCTFAEVSHQFTTGRSSVTDSELAVTKMVVLGYDRSVARRIAIQRPDLVRRVLKNDPLMKPVSVYRGIKAEPSRYEPTWEKAKALVSGGTLNEAKIWVGAEKAVGFRYGRRRPKNGQYLSTVIEYQLPLALFHENKGDPRINGITATGWIDPKEVPDERVFIQRLGVIDNRPVFEKEVYNEEADKLTEKSTAWYEYDRVYDNGSYVGPRR